MINIKLNQNPMPEQEPDVRNHNFLEVAEGYTEEMAINEAMRCLKCRKKPCVSDCPVNIKIPDFRSRSENSRKLIRSFQRIHHCLQSAAEYALRKTSARVYAHAARRVNRLRSEDSRDSLQTGMLLTTATKRFRRLSQTATR